MGCIQSGTGAIPPKSLAKNYEEGELLGKGAFSEVRRVKHKGSEKEFALKTTFRNSDKFSLSAIEAEVQALRTVSHANVVVLVDVFQDNSAVYLVQELAVGGDLSDRAFDTNIRLTETDARRIASQIFEAVEHLHTCGVVHRDLKPGNVLMMSNDPDSPKFNDIKLTDFGLSSCKGDLSVNTMVTQCGTPDFSAPELLQGADGKSTRVRPYSCKVDVWSAGAIVYCLLGRRPPFAYASGNTAVLIEKIREGAVKFPAKEWKERNPSARELIETMMSVHPDDRPAMKEARQLDWIYQDSDNIPT